MGEIDIRRVYNASPQRVWDAWTQPEQLASWWGKRGWNAGPRSIVLDVRPGGTFRVTTVNDEDGREMTNEGTYTEVDPRAGWLRRDRGDVHRARGRTDRDALQHDDRGDRRALPAHAGGVESAFERLEETLDMSTTTKIVTGVDYVGIPSNDIETARAFYENVLGLEASSVWQRPGEQAVGAEFETGTVTIALINCPRWASRSARTRRRWRSRSRTSRPRARSSSHAA